MFKYFLVSLFNFSIVLASAPPIRIKAGTIHGTSCNGTNTSVYRGIRYAQPPVGKLRFMPPQAMNSSFPHGTLNATQFSATCIQLPGPFAWTEPYESEDCLTLTVYVPPGNNNSGLPVKVFVHGGGDTGGSASFPLYDLCHMATDSIGVGIQYRLGPLGWLALDSAGIEGNMGIKDQIAALEWVQDNIVAFGGDPKKVLLFGQSSGADDIYAVSSLPQAKTLMNAVICESGGGLDLPPYETAQLVGADYAAALNCTHSRLACLQSRSVQELVEAYARLPIEDEGEGAIHPARLSSWDVADWPNTTDMASPILDGKLFKKQPRIVGPQVPILMGSNKYDGSLFAIPPLNIQAHTPVTVHNYTKFLSQFGKHASAVAQQYPISKFNSSGSTELAVIEALTAIETAVAFTCYTYRGLRSAANSGVPAYAYTFAHQLSCPWLENDGSPFPTKQEDQVFAQPMHTAEQPLVFGNLDHQPFGNGTCDMDAVERGLSEVFKASWTAMAATGNPSTEGFKWVPFDECANEGAYIDGGFVMQKLDFEECEFWDQINTELGGVSVEWPSCTEYS